MAQQESEVYDDEEFFSRYIEKRRRNNSPNELIEAPIIDELLGTVAGKRLLDLGCGDGTYGKKLLDQGLDAYHGVDASENMIRLTKEQLSGYNNAQVSLQDVQKFDFDAGAYDLVLSRLVLHYLENLDEVFAGIHQGLKEDGCFIFSVEHSIITSNYQSYNQQSKAKRQDWVVDNYFYSGARMNKWMGKEVIKYHRTLEEYVQLAKRTGFLIEELRESKPDRTHFAAQAEYERRMRIPLFLLFKLRKIG